MKNGLRTISDIALWLTLISFIPWNALAAQPEAPTLQVILDDTYPPFIFRNEKGELQGILRDTWEMWSNKTGIKVNLQGANWSEAQRRFNNGEADVIDTIFRSDARDVLYSFSAPYTSIDAAIFFSTDLSGIRDAETVRGFVVGVKDGDYCIDYLSNHGAQTFHRYTSYESLVDAAGRGEVRVFCMDQPPATYFLVKKGLADKFRETPPLYSEAFHWAVLKGNERIKTEIEAGFTRISTAERQDIEERWLGTAVLHESFLHRYRSVVLALGTGVLVLLAWIWAMRREVRLRTDQVRQALNDLAITEQRFRTIFDNINDAIFIQDAQTGAILLVNRRMAVMYGSSVDEALTLTIQELSEGQPPYSQAEALGWIHKAAQEPQLFEWLARKRDGSLFWVEVGARRAIIDGNSNRLLVVVRDISDRKAVDLTLKLHEAQLRDSEDRFRRLFEDTQAIQILIDPADGRIVDANFAAAAFYGYSRQKLCAMSVFDINTLEPEVVRSAITVIKHGVREFFTFHHRLASGEIREVEVCSGPINFPDRTLLCSTVHDITARRQVEAMRARLAAIVESSGDAIIGKDIDGTIASWNQGAETLYGYSLNEILGQTADHLAPPEHQREALELIARVNSGETIISHETEGLCKNGTRFFAAITLSPIRNDRGELIGISTITRDITRRRQVEAELMHYREDMQCLVAERTIALTEANRQLVEAKNAAEAANSAKTIFLANMSHEIRTPMNAILGFAQIMQRSPTLSAENCENVDVILRSGRNLLTLINGILEMSKVEAGRTDIVSAPCDLHALLDDLRAVFKVSTDARGLAWNILIAPEVPHCICVDEGKLRQILINLLGNAVKFTDEGGIMLRVRSDGLEDDRWRLVFEVEDSGPGITVADQEALFQPFRQAQAGVMRGGTGLGLAISRRYARLLGGEITVASTSERGSVFQLNVLVDQAASARGKSLPPIHGRALRVQAGPEGIRILIADDQIDNRLFLRRLLAPLGFIVREAENGQHALCVAKDWQPHLILMDIVMPVMGGHEAIRQIRAAPWGQDVPIIALSASAFSEDRSAVLASGANDFLRKPVAADALLETISALTCATYDYADPEVLSAAAITTALRSEITQRLPASILDPMRWAVYRSDDHGLSALIDSLPPDLQDIAETLRHALNHFDWDALENALGLPPD